MKLYLKTFFSFLKKKRCNLEKEIEFANSFQKKDSNEENLETQITEALLKNQKLKQKISFLFSENSKLFEENNQLKLELKNFFEQQDKYKKELLHTINQQRSVIEDKQLYISILEKKIKTLMNEIKNILKIEKNFFIKESSQIPSENKNQEFSNSYKEILKNKINAITKEFISCFKNQNFNSSQKDSLDSSINTYSINYRCFFDKLRKDEKHIIFFYSQKQFFFINNLFISWIGEKPNCSHLNNKTKGNNEWFNNFQIFSQKPEGFIEMQTKKRGLVSFYYTVKNILISDLHSYSIGILLPLNNKNC